MERVVFAKLQLTENEGINHGIMNSKRNLDTISSRSDMGALLILEFGVCNR